MTDLSLAEARRIALSAQGFAAPRNSHEPSLDDLRRVVEHVTLVQIDTVNVLARAHYLPFFSRLGPYRQELVDELAYSHRELFEYWGHAASFIPMPLFPLIRHRMQTHRRDRWLQRIQEEHPGFVERVLDEVVQRGPISVSDLSEPGGRTGPWWGLSRGKMALEWHFDRGAVAVEARRNFTRYYDVPEKVIPAAQLGMPAPTESEAQMEMLLLSAKSMGVGTASDLADYFRVRIVRARPLLKELVSSGMMRQVKVEGWNTPAYMLPDTNVPAAPISARALVSPFDSLIWERDRTERLFNLRYRIEIYVPENKRQFGYYVLPFLMNEELAARVDLKADRQKKRLLVQSAYLEDGRNSLAVADALAHELAEMARWLGLDRVVVGRKGDLAGPLRMACKK
jgi:hypothetical protein